jgi:hypothetical protein
MILPSRSRMWTACPSDCSTLEYCRSGSAAPAARPSRCSGDECGNDCDPRDQARGPPSKAPGSRLPGDFALGGGTPRRGETDCERRRSAALGTNLDISCLSCACPTSKSRIFFKSSSPLDSIPAGAGRTGVLTATDACSSSNRPSRRTPSAAEPTPPSSEAAPPSSKGRSVLRSRGRFDAKWSKNCELHAPPDLQQEFP